MPKDRRQPDERFSSDKPGADLWDFVADESEYPPFSPPLIEPLPSPNAPSLRHISASQIADIGEYRRGLSPRQRQSAARRFRQSAAGSLPAAAKTSPIGPQAVTPLVIGEIVHEYLCYGDFALEGPNAPELLRAIVWEKGITNPAAARFALHQVEDLISLHKSSDVQRWVNAARADGRPLYTELPFMFRAEKRAIHGVMDLALQQPDGEWAVIDYKTSVVIGGAYERHADRYLLQLGVYAAALRAKLGLDHWPQTYVHYLRGNRTVRLAGEDCIAELDRLESTLGELVPRDE